MTATQTLLLFALTAQNKIGKGALASQQQQTAIQVTHSG
jgi:hypothetical protein